MRLLILCLTISLVVLSTQGCTTRRTDQSLQTQASMESRQKEIIDRLIPEEGLPLRQRNQLVAATIAVLREGEREELINPNTLKATLRATSLSNLEKIEADYKTRLANADN